MANELDKVLTGLAEEAHKALSKALGARRPNAAVLHSGA